MKLFTLLKDVKTLTGLKRALESTKDEWTFYQRISSSSWVLLSSDECQRNYIQINVDLLNSAMNEVRSYDRTLDRETRTKQRIRGNGYHDLCDYMMKVEYNLYTD